MSEIDKRGVLDENIFSYRATKDGKLMLYWYEKHVKTLAGKEAQKLLQKLEQLEGKDVQLALAKATGNFKRGNERRQDE